MHLNPTLFAFFGFLLGLTCGYFQFGFIRKYVGVFDAPLPAQNMMLHLSYWITSALLIIFFTWQPILFDFPLGGMYQHLKPFLGVSLAAILLFSSSHFQNLYTGAGQEASREWKMRSLSGGTGTHRSLSPERIEDYRDRIEACLENERPGGWQPGIVVEEYASGEKVVFVPLSPKTTDGTVFLVKPEDVRPCSLNEDALKDVLLDQGKGLIPQQEIPLEKKVL